MHLCWSHFMNCLINTWKLRKISKFFQHTQNVKKNLESLLMVVYFTCKFRTEQKFILSVTLDCHLSYIIFSFSTITRGPGGVPRKKILVGEKGRGWKLREIKLIFQGAIVIDFDRKLMKIEICGIGILDANIRLWRRREWVFLDFGPPIALSLHHWNY